MLTRKWRNERPYGLLQECKVVHSFTLEKSLAVPQRLDTELPYDPATPLLGIYTRKMRTSIHTKLARNVCSNIIHNSQKVGTTQKPIN